jgi:hypothetical protein
LRQAGSYPILTTYRQGLPEDRKRRGVRYPQWLLAPMAIVEILINYHNINDLER